MKTEDLAKLLVWLLIVFALSACENEPGMKMATGDYSYRLAGAARVYFVDSGDDAWVTLMPETGTMTVVRTKEQDRCNATLYADNGNTYELPLYFAHDTVWIDQPVYRDILVKVNDRDELFNVRITGEGQVLKNGDLNLHLGYSGRSRNTGHNWTLTANPVNLHLNAKKR